jgi:hypothetical protein
MVGPREDRPGIGDHAGGTERVEAARVRRRSAATEASVNPG